MLSMIVIVMNLLTLELDPVVPTPGMTGFGRYRRSEAATKEWIEENTMRQLGPAAPYAKFGVDEMADHPGWHALYDESQGSSTPSSSSGGKSSVEVDPITGARASVVKGFSTTGAPTSRLPWMPPKAGPSEPQVTSPMNQPMFPRAFSPLSYTSDECAVESYDPSLPDFFRDREAGPTTDKPANTIASFSTTSSYNPIPKEYRTQGALYTDTDDVTGKGKAKDTSANTRASFSATSYSYDSVPEEYLTMPGAPDTSMDDVTGNTSEAPDEGHASSSRNMGYGVEAIQSGLTRDIVAPALANYFLPVASTPQEVQWMVGLRDEDQLSQQPESPRLGCAPPAWGPGSISTAFLSHKAQDDPTYNGQGTCTGISTLQQPLCMNVSTADSGCRPNFPFNKVGDENRKAARREMIEEETRFTGYGKIPDVSRKAAEDGGRLKFDDFWGGSEETLLEQYRWRINNRAPENPAVVAKNLPQSNHNPFDELPRRGDNPTKCAVFFPVPPPKSELKAAVTPDEATSLIARGLTHAKSNMTGKVSTPRYSTFSSASTETKPVKIVYTSEMMGISAHTEADEWRVTHGVWARHYAYRAHEDALRSIGVDVEAREAKKYKLPIYADTILGKMDELEEYKVTPEGQEVFQPMGPKNAAFGRVAQPIRIIFPPSIED